MNPENPQKKPMHIKDLCAKLQREVDSLLETVHEQALFAEFREEEIVDLRDGAANDFVRHTLDERVVISPLAKPRLERKIAAMNAPVGKVKKKARSILGYIFTPFAY
jgi:hypothetical protein